MNFEFSPIRKIHIMYSIFQNGRMITVIIFMSAKKKWFLKAIYFPWVRSKFCTPGVKLLRQFLKKLLNLH